MASWCLPQNPEDSLIMPTAYSCQYGDYGDPYYQVSNFNRIVFGGQQQLYDITYTASSKPTRLRQRYVTRKHRFCK